MGREDIALEPPTTLTVGCIQRRMKNTTNKIVIHLWGCGLWLWCCGCGCGVGGVVVVDAIIVAVGRHLILFVFFWLLRVS